MICKACPILSHKYIRTKVLKQFHFLTEIQLNDLVDKYTICERFECWCKTAFISFNGAFFILIECDNNLAHSLFSMVLPFGCIISHSKLSI